MLSRRALLSQFAQAHAAFTFTGISTVRFFRQGERLTERALDQVARIKVPSRIKDEILKGMRDEQLDRLVFTFGRTFLWGSMSGITKYRQLLVVSVLAPDATEATFARPPRTFTVPMDHPEVVHRATRGTAQLTVTRHQYGVGSDIEPSHVFEYRDRARRLHLIWHAVEDEVSLKRGLATLDEMAASFRIVAEPQAQFAEMKDRPNREAAERARRREVAIRMLTAAGLDPLVPGRPLLKDGVYLEWMTDPEPRYQLLVPLGRVKARSPQGGIPVRPTSPDRAVNGRAEFPGTVGWRAYRDGEWEFSNGENAYLPFAGVAALLAARHRDPGEVSYYYSAAVRVEEEESDARLTSLRWFTGSLPEVQKLWRDGALLPGLTLLPP